MLPIKPGKQSAASQPIATTRNAGTEPKIKPAGNHKYFKQSLSPPASQ